MMGRRLVNVLTMLGLATIAAAGAHGTELAKRSTSRLVPHRSLSSPNVLQMALIEHGAARSRIASANSLVAHETQPGLAINHASGLAVDSLEIDEANRGVADLRLNESSYMPSWETWTSPDRIVNSIRVVAIMAALSLAPALLLMTTCYVRLVIVLGLLRQALGSQQLPPQQIITTLAMFLTALIMWPVWSQVHRDAIEPYSNPEVSMSAEAAWSHAVEPIRVFMIEQIRRAGNGPDVAMFLDYLDVTDISTNAEIPLQALLPAFLISELKTAFLIGFQIYLPFLILDLVVSSITMSMGMVMVPPSTIALPLKLIMFVLVDGWHLVVEMLLLSFSTG